MLSITTLSLKIHLQQPTAAVDFGLQKGKGSAYEPIQIQRSSGHDLQFFCEVQLKYSAGGKPDLFGPFVQGPAGERFLYIDIGTLAKQKNTPWTRRLKIPLSGILLDPDLLKNNEVNAHFSCIVPGVGKDGGPNCGTVKPFDGWKKQPTTPMS